VLALDVALQESLTRTRKVTVTAVDRDGRPLEDATIQVTTFHHALAQDRAQTALSPVGNGRYTADIRFSRPGLWEFQFTVLRGVDAFTAVELRDLPAVLKGPS
jgi:nitrogen fixation protein FixH